MKSFAINVGKMTTMQNAQEAALKSMQWRDEDVTLVSWYDRNNNTGGPMEVCGGEPEKCVADYARSHGAQYRVNVNDYAYEFFFTKIPHDVTEIKREGVIASHKGLEQNRFENVQGG